MSQPNQKPQPLVDDNQPQICSSISNPCKELKNILMNNISFNSNDDEMLENLLKGLMLLAPKPNEPSTSAVTRSQET